MASQRNEIPGSDGEGIGQGGAPLFAPPERPPSALNPATAAWVPGKLTVKDLEASYIRATTTDPVTGELLPGVTGHPLPIGYGRDGTSIGQSNNNINSGGPTTSAGQMPRDFVAQVGGQGSNGQVGGLSSNFMANRAGGTTATSPRPGNLIPSTGLHGSLNSLGGFNTNTRVGGCCSTSISRGQINDNFAHGGCLAPSHAGAGRPVGLGIYNPVHQSGGSITQGSGSVGAGGVDTGGLGIQGTNLSFQPAANNLTANTVPGRLLDMGPNAGVPFLPLPLPSDDQFSAFAPGLTGGDNSGAQGIRHVATSNVAGVQGTSNFSNFQGLPQQGYVQNWGNAGSGEPQAMRVLPSGRVMPISAPKFDPGNVLGQRSDQPLNDIQPSNCFLGQRSDSDKPPNHIEPSNCFLPSRDTGGMGAPGISQSAFRVNPDSPATLTPVRAGRTSHLAQESPGTVRSGQGTATPRTAVPHQPSPQRVAPGSGRHLILVQSPTDSEDNTMVLFDPPVADPSIHTHGLIVQKPMRYPPPGDPQVLNFRGQIYALDLPPLPDAAVDYLLFAQRSEPLQILTCGVTGYPPVIMALDPNFFPFEPLNENARRPDYGVVKIKNIPFNTKRCEVVALFGKNAKLLNDVDEPIHIIMDRVSSKTNDVYVEFIDMESATRAVERFKYLQEKDKPPRLGDRNVEMQLSSQAALMAELFPLAKNVIWDGCNPLIIPPNLEKTFDNFRGFVSEEEMFMLVKHVDTPHRSPYSKDCPQRPYECLISTIKKMPWNCTEGITIRQRHAMYDATISLIHRLQAAIVRPNPDPDLSKGLLNRIVQAAMYCPGFSMVQKDGIACEVNMSDFDVRSYSVPRFAAAWRHFYGIRPKVGIPLDLIEWYAAVIRQETIRLRSKFPPALRNQIRVTTEQETDSYFGDIWVELWRPAGQDFDMETIAEATDRELMCIERVLRRALPN